MSDFSDDDYKFESDDSLGSHRMSLSPAPRRTGGSSRGSRSSSLKSHTRVGGGGAAGRTATERPRGKGILPVSEDIANSRSSSASSSVREKSTSRNTKNSTQMPLGGGGGVPGSDATYEELFGAVERQQRDDELRRINSPPSEEQTFSLGTSGQTDFTLAESGQTNMGLSIQSLGMSPLAANLIQVQAGSSSAVGDGSVIRQATSQYKPPRPSSPQATGSPGFGGGTKGTAGWGKLPDTTTTAGRRPSTHQQSRARRTSSPGLRADSVSGRLSVFDDLLSSKRASDAASFYSMGSSMREDIERALVTGGGAGRPLGDGPFDLGGRFQARNRFIYFGKDHMYSSMDSVYSMTHPPAPRDHRRKKHIPSIPHSYPLPEISFTMADLAKMRWKAKTRNYKPVGPFKSEEEMLTYQGVTKIVSFTKVETLSPDIFKKMQWKRPLHFHHCHHRRYRRNYLHDLKWQDTQLEPAPELPNPRRPLHELGTGSPAYGRGSIIYLPHDEESMVVEESLAYCITVQHLHRFEAACVSSFELIMKQERASRRLIGRSFAKFVSMHIDAMLRGIEGNETRARNKLMKEILGTEDSSELKLFMSEGSMRFILMCEEEEYLVGISALMGTGLAKVLGVEKHRRDEYMRHQNAEGTTGTEEEWMVGGKYERYILGATRRADYGQQQQYHQHGGYPRSPYQPHYNNSDTLQSPQLLTPTRPVNFTCESSEQPRSRPVPRTLHIANSPHQSLIPMSMDDCNDAENGGGRCGTATNEYGGVEEQECSALVEIQPSVMEEEVDPFTARLRVRPPRQPRRPATSGGGGATGRSRALVTTPRGDGKLPTLADTLDAFIHNQWALPNAGLRSPSPPTQQQQHHYLPYQQHIAHNSGDATAASATPRPLPRPTSSPPRHLSPDHRRQLGADDRITSPTREQKHHLSQYEEVRPLVIGQASHHASCTSPIGNRTNDNSATNHYHHHSSTSSPLRRQKSPNNIVSASELRMKLERFDEEVYTGDISNRRSSPMRGGGDHWSELNLGDVLMD